MRETLWGPAIAVFGGGLAAGVLFAVTVALRSRRRQRVVAAAGGGRGLAEPPRQHRRRGHGAAEALAFDSAAQAERVADLRSRKTQLFEQLRDLQDMASATAEERAELELQAARVMQQLDEAERTGPCTTADEAPVRSSGPVLVLKGALALGVLLLVGLALWQGVRPREEGMGATGSDFARGGGGGAAVAGDGEGHPTDRQAGPIVARETPRLQAARAAVEADPESIDARVELGYALAEAGGWIDVNNNVETILARDPNNADALIQAAMLRFAMRQPGQADALIEQVLQHEPDNVRALEVGGRLAFGAESWSRAVELLERAAAKIGPQSGLESLLEAARARAMASGGGAAASETAGARAQPPQAALGGGAQAAQAPAEGSVSGSIALAEGVGPPASGVLFVMARPAGVTAGPPVAAVRLPVGTFPQPFRIDRSNAMMGGALPATLSLSARLDADGNAATRQPEDLSGLVEGAVALGTSDVQIVLRPAAK